MRKFSCLLIGPPGSGKTTAASTAPGPVLFLDVDDKLDKMVNLESKLKSGQIIQWAIKDPISTMSMTRMAREATSPQAKVTQTRPKGYEHLGIMIDALVDSKCVISHNGKQIQVGTVVLDSYTSTQEHLKRLLMAANSTVTISQPLWGTVLTNFENLNNTLLRLPANIIIICHEKPTKDELTGKIIYSPLIEGSMRSKIGKDFEEVYFLEKRVQGGTVKYEMLTVGSSMKACRTSRLLPPVVEPDFSKIYK